MVDKSKHTLLGGVLIILLVSISLFIMIKEQMERPVEVSDHDIFLEMLENESVKDHQFSKVTGYNTSREIELSDEVFLELLELLIYELEANDKGRYNSTEQYSLNLDFESGESFDVDFLLQNYDEIMVIFGNRKFSSNMILGWFLENKNILE